MVYREEFDLCLSYRSRQGRCALVHLFQLMEARALVPLELDLAIDGAAVELDVIFDLNQENSERLSLLRKDLHLNDKGFCDINRQVHALTKAA